MSRRYATIDDILATYSSHISDSYPSPEEYREDLDRILEAKKDRFGGAEYIASLEINIIFLHDVVSEGEALLDVIFDRKKSKSLDSGYITNLLIEIEERVRARSGERRKEIFIKNSDEEFAELHKVKSSGGAVYRNNLEETYRYLMTFKIFLFELFNVMESLMQDHPLARATQENRARVLNHIELITNYYLGNIEVGDTKDR